MTPERAAVLRADILEYVVRSIVRHAGDFPPRFAENLRRSVRRNFHSSISAAAVERFTAHYTEAYQFALEALPPFIGPKVGKHLSDEDVRREDFLAHIAARYPEEPRAVLEAVAGFAIMNGYIL